MKVAPNSCHEITTEEATRILRDMISGDWKLFLTPTDCGYRTVDSIAELPLQPSYPTLVHRYNTIHASTMTNSSSGTEQPPKRRKIQVACNNCRDRKQRCNGSHPCASCERRGVADQCSYEELSWRTQQSVSIEYDCSSCTVNEEAPNRLPGLSQRSRRGSHNLSSTSSKATLNQRIVSEMDLLKHRR